MKFNLQQIPREIVYIALIICLVLPFFVQWKLPIFVSNASRGLYDTVEEVHAKDPKKPVFVLSCWGPGTRGENGPQLEAVVKHLTKLKHPFIVFSPILSPLAPRMSEEVLLASMAELKGQADENGEPWDFEYGRDYVNLGFKGITGPSIAPMLKGLDGDLRGLLPEDFYGTPIKDLSVMDEMDSLSDAAMIVSIGDGVQGEDIIGVFSSIHPEIPVGIGAWSLICTKLYPYFDSKQLCGLLDGMNGASEYLAMLDPTKGSSKTVNALTLGRSLLIFLIVIGNIGMLIDRSRKKRGLPVTPPPMPPEPGEKRWVNMAMVIFSIGFVALLIAELIWATSHGLPWNWHRAGIWVAAFCTIGMMSFAFGDNKLYRILEHVIIGSAAAYSLFEVIDKQFIPNFINKVIAGYQSVGADVQVIPGGAYNLLWLLVLIPSSLWFTIYFKKLAWTNKLVVGLLMGVTVGISFEKFTNLCIPQIISSFKPFIIYTAATATTAATTTFSLNNLIYVSTMIFVLLYFVFCFKRKTKTTKSITRFGRVLMMIAFGAVFGNTVATRMSWLIGCLEILTKWVGEMPFGK